MQYKIMVKGIVQFDAKYLIVQRWYDDRIGEPYQWEFIDGKLEYTEGPDAAVLRIIKESTGLDVIITRILYTWSFMSGDVCNIGISYECMAVSDEVILSEDLNDYKWIKKEEFTDYIENKMLLEDIARVEL